MWRKENYDVGQVNFFIEYPNTQLWYRIHQHSTMMSKSGKIEYRHYSNYITFLLWQGYEYGYTNINLTLSKSDENDLRFGSDLDNNRILLKINEPWKETRAWFTYVTWDMSLQVSNNPLIAIDTLTYICIYTEYTKQYINTFATLKIHFAFQIDCVLFQQSI